MHIGIDIEQFVRDPYGSGIQRVLQYLALEWPDDVARADFVVPVERGHALLTPAQAAQVLSVPFGAQEPGADLRPAVAACIEDLDAVVVGTGDLLALYDAWLLPEVSYLPGVLQRMELFGRCVPTAMIGYDTLPMSEPANYRFRPGTAVWVSEYFRHLATADAVVCISDYARDSILGRLRRDPALPIAVAHPGGDHVPVGEQAPAPPVPRFLRLGTLEGRKRPREVLAAFREAVARGLLAELVFVGGPSASDEAINADVRAACTEGIGVTWVQGAGDDEVAGLIAGSSAFLSLGVEGYGIPVLEALRLGTPVLFDGVQPAAELVVGSGAARIAGLAHEDLVAALLAYGRPGALDALRAEVRAEAVPTWSAFARDVARAVASA
jgi:glycosyltransferase involved in cell wall biosynthesis